MNVDRETGDGGRRVTEREREAESRSLGGKEVRRIQRKVNNSSFYFIGRRGSKDTRRREEKRSIYKHRRLGWGNSAENSLLG